MKKVISLICIGLLGLIAFGCKSEAPAAGEKQTDTAAKEVVATEEAPSEGLTAAEEKAFTRDELVNAGGEIGTEDIEKELQKLEAEIYKEVGDEPSGGTASDGVPSASKTYFSPETLGQPSPSLSYEREMAVMKAIRSYKKKKEADAKASTGSTFGAPDDSES